MEKGILTDRDVARRKRLGVIAMAKRMTKGVLTDSDIKRAESLYNPQRNFASRTTEFYRKVTGK